MDEYFKVLDLYPDASIDDVKSAYRDLAQIWHPDRHNHNPRLRAKAEERFKAINEAYQAIISETPQRRRTRPPGSTASDTRSYTCTQQPTATSPTAIVSSLRRLGIALCVAALIIPLLFHTFGASSAPRQTPLFAEVPSLDSRLQHVQYDTRTVLGFPSVMSRTEMASAIIASDRLRHEHRPNYLQFVGWKLSSEGLWIPFYYLLFGGFFLAAIGIWMLRWAHLSNPK